AKQYDEQHFIICNVQNNYGISNSGKNQSIVARGKHSIKKQQKVEINLTEDSSSQMLAKLKLEREKLELAKLRRELSLSGLNN
ncbi:27750_t:CDS:2, partial [Gigaspora margarita]